MTARTSALWCLASGLAVVLLGCSYYAWGNWIPFAEKINDPTVAGVMQIVVGVAILVVGAVMWAADYRDRI